MIRSHVYEQAAASPEDGSSGGGGAAGVIEEGAEGASEAGLEALPEWMGELVPELAGVAREAKWETPSDAFKSYNELLKVKGVPANRLVTLPGSAESDESKAMLSQMLGVPGESSEYELGTPELPEGVTDMSDSLRDALHAARVPADAAPALIQSIHEAVIAQSAAAEEVVDAKFAEAKAALRDKWGGEYDERRGNMRKAYDLLGVPNDQADKIAMSSEGGPEQFFMRLEELGRRMGEPTDHGKHGGSTGGSGYVSQAQAEARLDEIVADHTKDPNDPAVRKEIDRLAKIARPEKLRL